MTNMDLDHIERGLGFALPVDYRRLMLNHPMNGRSEEDLMLTNTPEQVIDPFRLELVQELIAQTFIIGSDGGKEVYFMDAGQSPSPMYVDDFEAGASRVLSDDLAAFIKHIESIDSEIAADEERARLARLARKWWQFWK